MLLQGKLTGAGITDNGSGGLHERPRLRLTTGRARTSSNGAALKRGRHR
jgi:hypothetical protein